MNSVVHVNMTFRLIAPIFTLRSVAQRNIHLGKHFTRGSSKEIELQTPVPLAGRKYLASSESPGFPKFLHGPREDYPLLIKVKNHDGATPEHWARRCSDIIEQAYNKYEEDRSHVAILFRGLPIKNAKDLSLWTNNLGYEPFPYLGGTGPRNEVEKNVADGSKDDKEYTIEPHNEMAYSAKYPKIFVIGMFEIPPWGGETAICDNREVHAQLDASFVEKCERLQIRYMHSLPDMNSIKPPDRVYKTWQQQFYTEDRFEVERYLNENRYSWTWENDGGLFYWHNKPPYIEHTRSAEKLWFNQVTGNHSTFLTSIPSFEGVKLSNDKYPIHTSYGNGEEFESGRIDEHRRVTWESAVGFQWNNNDVLFVDQLIIQHSRLGFEGDRKVGVSLLNY